MARITRIGTLPARRRGARLSRNARPSPVGLGSPGSWVRTAGGSKVRRGRGPSIRPPVGRSPAPLRPPVEGLVCRAMPDVEAHITGTVWKIECEVGQKIEEGDTV